MESVGISPGKSGAVSVKPIVLFIFNRPEMTKLVFDQIAAVEPEKLFIIADGPRENYPDEQKRCRATREVVDEIEWGCDVHRNYADSNLGLKERFRTGLDWVFDQVEAAIILEDDCYPDESFFDFCQIMLDWYRDDTRVMDITGTNFLGTWKSNRQDYHFSSYGGIWGWATWQRAWQMYDADMEQWADSEMKRHVRDFLADDNQYEYQKRAYQRTYEGKIETWDYQWGFAKHINSGLSIVPARNLVRNLGFGTKATNTLEKQSALIDKDLYSFDESIESNDFVVADRAYDRRFHRQRTSIWQRHRLLRLLRDFYVKRIQDRR
jgi:hypothetical protein